MQATKHTTALAQGQNFEFMGACKVREDSVAFLGGCARKTCPLAAKTNNQVLADLPQALPEGASCRFDRPKAFKA